MGPEGCVGYRGRLQVLEYSKLWSQVLEDFEGFRTEGIVMLRMRYLVRRKGRVLELVDRNL